jgi:hypothetical protein
MQMITAGNDLVTNLSKLGNRFSNPAIANFLIFDDIHAKSKTLNKLLWDIIKMQNNSTPMHNAITALGNIQTIPPSLPKTSAHETHAQLTIRIYDGFKAFDNAIRSVRIATGSSIVNHGLSERKNTSSEARSPAQTIRSNI